MKSALESETSRERTAEDLLTGEDQHCRLGGNRENRVPETKLLQSDSQNGQSGSEEIEQGRKGQQGSFSDSVSWSDSQ